LSDLALNQLELNTNEENRLDDENSSDDEMEFLGEQKVEAEQKIEDELKKSRKKRSTRKKINIYKPDTYRYHELLDDSYQVRINVNANHPRVPILLPINQHQSMTNLATFPL
ncbi:27413_t:CDS:2, partial [Racocetra persica]